MRHPSAKVFIVLTLIAVGALAVVSGVSSDLSPGGSISNQVKDNFEGHLRHIESSNVTLLMGDYQTNASLTWEGVAGGYAGEYEGTENISALYHSILPHFVTLKISNTTDSIQSQGQEVSVNASFRIAGVTSSQYSGCPSGGDFNGTISARISYQQSGNAWYISEEVWNFLYPFSSGICA